MKSNHSSESISRTEMELHRLPLFIALESNGNVRIWIEIGKKIERFSLAQSECTKLCIRFKTAFRSDLLGAHDEREFLLGAL